MGQVWSANFLYYDEKLRQVSAGVYYDINQVTNESIFGLSGTLTQFPIISGTVVLTNGTETYIDNGSNVLVSSLSSGVTGTINYLNGNWSVPSWQGAGSETASYVAVVNLISLNWDDVMFPTIDCRGHFVAIKDQAVAHEVGVLKDVSKFVGIEEYSKFVDLLRLIPEKFRSSIALQQLLYVLGLQVGTWVGKINDLQSILDKYSVGDNYIQYLSDLVGLKLIISPTTTFANKQQQLLQVIDWYKMKGTYQALKVAGYTLGINLTLWDLYTNDYINFVMEPWYAGAIGTNPPGLDSSYYKSPHIGVETDLIQVYGTAPNYYLFDGANTYNNLITYVERVRPINVVPQYSLLLNPITTRAGVVEGDQFTTTSSTAVTIPTSAQLLTGPVNVSLTVGTGLNLSFGQDISIVYNSTNKMQGTVVYYNPGTNTETISGVSGTLQHTFLVPGTLVLSNGTETFTDNGSSILVSSLSFGHSGTINYSTGAWSVTGWIGSGVETATYRSQLVVAVTYVVGSGTYSSWNILGNIDTITLGGWITSQVLYDRTYSTGTVYIVNGSTTLHGLGTAWTTNLSIGDQIGFGSTNPSSITTWYDVGTIVSDTQITLVSGTIVNESISGTSGNLVNSPIIGGTLVITNGTETFYDNGSNVLISEFSTGHTGTINYTTGHWTVTGWYGSGSETAKYRVSTYVGPTLSESSGTVYVSAPYYDASHVTANDITYDSAQSTFFNDITVWQLGIGNVGVIPDSGFTMQHPVLANTPGYNSNDTIVSSPITINIQNTFVEFSFTLPNNITQSSLTELGLYSSGGPIRLGCTFPAVSIVPGVSLRVVVHVNY